MARSHHPRRARPAWAPPLAALCWLAGCSSPPEPPRETAPPRSDPSETPRRPPEPDPPEACPTGWARCGGSDCGVSLQRDSQHCGSCATTCGDAQQCVAGSCRGGVVELAAGATHSCARSADAQVWCWGLNGVGQLGLPGPEMRPRPTPVPALTGARALALGTYFGCLIDADASLRCWGEFYLNGVEGEWGRAREVLKDVVAVDAGQNHVCAVERGGGVRCLGANTRGQLGIDPDAGVPPPVGPVPGLTEVVQVAAGRAHSCALTRSGEVYCWGMNSHGQLGDGGRDDRHAPARPLPLKDVVQVAAGGRHSCALGRDGALHCWGRNDAGQLGLGDTRDRRSPARVPLQGVVQVRLGNRHSCALGRDGALRCWGEGEAGRLGLGDERPRSGPGPALALPPTLAFAVADRHGCALGDDGRVRCWGLNDGQLGDGTTVLRTKPTDVAGLVPTRTEKSGKKPVVR